MKVQRDEGGGRILLGDNTSGGAVMLQLIWFQCVGVWISTVLPCTAYKYIYIYLFIYLFIYLQFTIRLLNCKNSICAGRSESRLLRKSKSVCTVFLVMTSKHSTLKMESVDISEKFVMNYHTTLCHIP